MLFINYKKQFIINNVHVFTLLLHVKTLGFLQQCFVSFFTQEFNKRLVFRKATECPEQ